MKKEITVFAVISLLAILSLPAMGKEIIKETTKEVTREITREVTKEVIKEDKGIRPYGLVTYGQYKMEDFNEFLNLLATISFEEEEIFFVDADPEPIDSGLSYEAGLVFPIASLLKIKIGAQYYSIKNDYRYKLYLKDQQPDSFIQSHVAYSFRALGGIAKVTLGTERANIYLGTGYYKGTYKAETYRWSMDDAPPYSSYEASDWLGRGYEAGIELKIARVNLSVGYASLIMPREEAGGLWDEFDFTGLRGSIGLEF